MKISKYIIPLLFISLLLTSACKKEFLENEPLGMQTSENLFNTAENATLAVNACYDPLSWDEVDNADHNYEWMFGDVMSDDSEKGSMPSDLPQITEMQEWRTTANNSFTAGLWHNVYIGLFRCNTVILNLPEAEGINTEIKNQLLGEAYFLRGYYYFYLARIFGGVPLFDAPVNPSEIDNVQRASLAQTYAQIDADFAMAASLLPTKSQYDANEMGRATKGAAQAYQARVAMYQIGTDNANNHNWQEVYDLTNAIIGSGEYSLASNYSSIFEMEGENGSGSIFEVQCVSNNEDWGPRKTGTTNTVIQNPRTTWGWGFNNPTQNLMDSYETNDPRMANVMYGDGSIVHGDVIEIDIAENATGYLSRKAALEPAFKPSNIKDSPQNIRKFRLADVILMNAEAAYHTGNESSAITSVNQIRARAKASTYPKGASEGSMEYDAIPEADLEGVLDPLANTLTGQDLLNAIWKERRNELAMETLRYWDLIRTGRYLNTLSDEVKGRCQSHSLTGTANIVPVLPIPVNEVQSWGLSQNPGY